MDDERDDPSMIETDYTVRGARPINWGNLVLFVLFVLFLIYVAMPGGAWIKETTRPLFVWIWTSLGLPPPGS